MIGRIRRVTVGASAVVVGGQTSNLLKDSDSLGHFVDERVHKAENGLAILAQVVVQERQHTGKDGRACRGS